MEYGENKICDFTDAHNKLVDANFELEDEIKNLKLKVIDLEDRSRRNNVKLRGIPENIKPFDLKHFLNEMISILLPKKPTVGAHDRPEHTQ